MEAQCRHGSLWLILGALFILVIAAAANDKISINCGSSAPFRAHNGIEWLGEFHQEFFTIEGLSTTVSSKNDLDLAPYSTARVSRSQFAYRFRLNPGEKFIRLHFSHAHCEELEHFTDFFTVEAGLFTLLYNFSASITSLALSQGAVVKEFCLTVEENQPLDLVFTPTQNPLLEAYAFVNGIEILSMPPDLSYCHGRATGVQIVGQKDQDATNIDRGTALEIVRRVDVRLDPIPNLIGSDGSIFRIWERSLWKKEGFKADKNMTWKTFLDVGFRYLVRIHFSDIGLEIAETEGNDFSVVIDGKIAATAIDVLRLRDEEGSLRHKNYMIVVNGHKREGKREIVISFHSEDGFFDENCLFEGFEIFKISNLENSLAGPNPSLPLMLDSSSLNAMHTMFLLIGRRNAFFSGWVVVICTVNIIFYLLRRIHGDELIEEVVIKKPSARAERLFRLFSLNEIKLVTDDFHDRFLIGKGGFGKVYKGIIDNGKLTVAIKRSKVNSKQGKRAFWTEIETLSELRHVNLVSLIGYCREEPEMILVYEYISSGSLSDHLYKLARKNTDFSTLSWTKRLSICIGAARGLDYLHTGHGVIHRDIKSSNILLDENLLAKVSDFGLAKWESGKVLQSQESKHRKGTLGYMDPDYFRTGRLTTKSDTYSFGVVMLEVLCGRPAVEPLAEEDKRSLTMWVQSKISRGELDSIIDPIIEGEILPDSLTTFLGITEKCLFDDPNKRPTIACVLINLEHSLEQQERGKSWVPNEITMITDFLPVASKPMTEQFNSRMLLDEKKQRRKAAMQKLARFWPFNARKSSNQIAISAPISHRTGKVAFKINNALDKKMTGGKELNTTSGERVFSYSELKTATENFKTPLGRGGFGTVYKGWLKGNLGAGIGNRYPVAVKALSPNSMQGVEEWKSEVIFLAKISHSNLVKLIGYCCEDMKLLIVYEFMELGSLDVLLFKRDSSAPVLPWDIRLRILIGVARGLEFLHFKNIIWRDAKSSNILLDEMFNPKISDFGLAKSGPGDDHSHVTTRVIGTMGYSAPEYVFTGHLSFKSDVYGFGVVMLETLTGSPVTDRRRTHGQQNLIQWLKPLLRKKEELKNIMDSSLNGNYSPNAAYQATCFIEKCLGSDPKTRPSMEQARESLEKIRSLSDQEHFDYS